MIITTSIRPKTSSSVSVDYDQTEYFYTLKPLTHNTIIKRVTRVLYLNHVYVVYPYSVTGTFPFNSISDTQGRYPCTVVYGPFNTIWMVMHVYIWQIMLVGLHSRVYGTFIVIIFPTLVFGDILFPHASTYLFIRLFVIKSCPL